MNYVKSFNLLGIDAKQIPCITGEGAPTTSTEGVVGCLYMDTLKGNIYRCTNVVDGIHTWVYDELFDYEYSPNLLDLNSLEDGKYIYQENGNLYNNQSYTTSDFIPCKPGDVIRHQFTFAVTRYDNTEKPNYCSIAKIASYDENKDFVADSYVGPAYSYTVPEGASYVRCSFVKQYFNNGNYSEHAIIISDSPAAIPFSEYGSIVSKTIKQEYIPTNMMVKAFLPKEICVAVDRTIELYNNQVCMNAEKYHFKWVCDVGEALERKFSIKGTTATVGEYNLVLYIKDDELNNVWCGTTTVKIVPETTDSFSICCIGDSLTNNKAWLGELKVLNQNISLVGTRGTAPLKHEGRSGFTATQYLNDTVYSYESEGVHPFWNSATSRFDWNYYVQNSLGGVSPDAVQIFLGTNGIALDPTANANSIKQIVDYIIQDNANMPIFIVNTLFRPNQDGIGRQVNSDGFSGNKKGVCKQEEDMKVFNLMVKLNELFGGYNNIYFVPIATCHDSEYNFGEVEVAVNPRASQTIMMPKDGTHPQNQGYYQMADIMFSALSAHMGLTENSSTE